MGREYTDQSPSGSPTTGTGASKPAYSPTPRMIVEQIRISSDLTLPVLRTAEHPCPYLPGREAAEHVALVAPLTGNDQRDIQHLLDHRFRRSGTIYYRPACPSCQACMPIRVPIATFQPTRSQRRAARRNVDVEWTITRPDPSEEAYDLYRAYERAVHREPMIESRDAFDDFFGAHSFVETLQFEYRLNDRLVGVGLVDQAAESLSSVYFYYDPLEARRSLGVFSAMCEIEACRERGLPYWYVGYFIDGCRKMSYKTRFGPYELQQPDGEWHAC